MKQDKGPQDEEASMMSMTPQDTGHVGQHDLPAEQQAAFVKAMRLEWISILSEWLRWPPFLHYLAVLRPCELRGSAIR